MHLHRPLFASLRLAILAIGPAAIARQSADSGMPAQPSPATAPRTVSPAQAEPPAVPTTRGSMFTDPEDGAFDAGAFILSAQGVLPLPILITEPAVGYGGGAGLLFLRYPDGKTPAERATEARAAGEQTPRVELPDISGVVGGATENGTWFAGGMHLEIFDEGDGRSTTVLLRAHAELDYYGPGGESEAISYSDDVWNFRQQIEHRVGRGDWFLGARYAYISSDAVFDAPASILPPELPDEFKSATGGLGLTVSHDSRDTPFTPGKGNHSRLVVARFDDVFGGDYAYTRVDLDSSTWWTLDPRLVFGWHIETHLTPGDGSVPFYHQPMIALRGVPAARYQGRQTIANEFELRYTLTRRWSLVGFGGVGQVTMDDPEEVFDADLVPAGGVGFRYLLARQLGMHVGCDFAWSEDDFAFYLTLGNAWNR